MRLTAPVTDTDNLNGTGTLTNGNSVQWSADKTAPFMSVKKVRKQQRLFQQYQLLFLIKLLVFPENLNNANPYYLKMLPVWSNEQRA